MVSRTGQLVNLTAAAVTLGGCAIMSQNTTDGLDAVYIDKEISSLPQDWPRVSAHFKLYADEGIVTLYPYLEENDPTEVRVAMAGDNVILLDHQNPNAGKEGCAVVDLSNVSTYFNLNKTIPPSYNVGASKHSDAAQADLKSYEEFREGFAVSIEQIGCVALTNG